MNLFIQSKNWVADEWNSRRLLLDMFGNDVIIHIKFVRMSEEVISCRGFIAL